MSNTTIQEIPINKNNQSEQIDKLLPDLLNVHGQLDDIKPSKKNGFFNSDYVPLNKLIEVTKPILREFNLLITQGGRYSDGGLLVTTKLIHITGQWIYTEIRVPIGDKKTAQSVGGAMTYGRRYGFAAVLFLSCDKDDDGNEISSVNTSSIPSYSDVKGR